MEEITLQLQRVAQSGWLVAWWDDPDGAGGITTQGQDLRDLQQQITRQSQFTLTKARLLAESASTS